MKKELLTHFLFLTAFFLIVTLFRFWPISELSTFTNIFSTTMTSGLLAFWIGGIIGTLLPDIDHFIYIYFLRPHEVTSQRVSNLMSQKNYKASVNLLSKTNKERTNLVFHNAIFQVIFIIFAYFVVSSSGSFLGTGIVLAFSLHLLVDQATDLVEKRTIHHWFEGFPIKLTALQQKWYMIANIIILLMLGLFL